MTNQPASDETRFRLIAAGRTIFANLGYGSATTRQICELAKANAAAVNYHFGDKLGLYSAVLKQVIGDDQMTWSEDDWLALPPHIGLRRFILTMFTNLMHAEGSDAYAKLMAHEMSQPTEGLTVAVEQLIRPRALVLCAIVGKLVGRPANANVTRLCVHSVIGQVMHHIHSRPVIRLLWPEWRTDPKASDDLVDHITRFSLAGIAACAQENTDAESKNSPRKTKRQSK